MELPKSWGVGHPRPKFLGFLDTNSACAYDHDFAAGAVLSRVSLSIRILVAEVATRHMAVMGKYDVVHKTGST